MLSPQAQHDNFSFFTHEMHILSTIIIQSRQVWPKGFILKLRKMENSYFDSLFLFFFFGIFENLALNAQVNPNIEKR